MKSFIDWAKENNKEIPSLEAPTEENTKRTGLTANYPDSYVRGQYPHKYFNPIKATADLDLEQKPKG